MVGVPSFGSLGLAGLEHKEGWRFRWPSPTERSMSLVLYVTASWPGCGHRRYLRWAVWLAPKLRFPVMGWQSCRMLQVGTQYVPCRFG
jgi:hypothetical protein